MSSYFSRRKVGTTAKDFTERIQLLRQIGSSKKKVAVELEVKVIRILAKSFRMDRLRIDRKNPFRSNSNEQTCGRAKQTTVRE
ncbi:hypothetical protein [Leptospira adleri]|uniref:Uncharacterized protein n=1 Tax=Leptospira adleri TaxID=2023186 RepID=A0A2M9YNW1_9LEPT|nr:hypothetical protein [Leptospira adleri]PJZ53211.1 hypothetical protein CH380_10390 [Leptospira adleri]PJZ63981.1 hypothetical protein CH376_00720 [Leptospira adleri]